MVFNNRQMPQSVLYTAERHAVTGGHTRKNRFRCCRKGENIAMRRGRGHTYQHTLFGIAIATLPKIGNCTETGYTEEIIGTVRAFRQRLQFRPVGNVPAFGTDPAHGRIRRHAASRGHLVIVQITLCGDRRGIVLVRIPQARTDLGTGGFVTQIVGHPYHSVDLYRAVVLALVIQSLGRIAGAVVGIDIRAATGFRAGSTARFSTGLRARAAAGILPVIGISSVRISGARQFSAIDPIGYLAAQTDLDLQRAVVGNDDRKIVAPAAFERRIFDRLRTGLTIAERYGNGQRRLLRNEDRPVDGVGNHLVGPGS